MMTQGLATGLSRMRSVLPAAVLLGLCLALGACACRPGVIGPYGARPPRCWVW